MARWIADGSVALREEHGTRTENHNSASGSPAMSVRLSVPPANVKLAISKLLGTPEVWPFDGVFNTLTKSPVAMGVNVSQNKSRGTTDGDNQIINYDLAFLDVTYAVRHGAYTNDYTGLKVYVDTTIAPQNETRTLNHRDFIWGEQQDVTPSDTTLVLTPDATPVDYDIVDEVVYTIEGWTHGTDTVGDLVGTTNNALFYSGILARTFASGTLMLRNIAIDSQFSHISYRLPNASPTGIIDFSGLATPVLRLTYMYKQQGWDKFWRVDVGNNTSGFYYIRINSPPSYGRYLPFPPANHTNYLMY